MQHSLESLVQILGKLPGVGPRQARRFAYALTRQKGMLGNELAFSIQNLKGFVFSCELCGATSVGDGNICSNCSKDNRDPKTLALVANQEDYDSLCESDKFRGMVAIVPFPHKIELAETMHVVEKSYIPKTLEFWKNKGLEEIILAFPISPEGEIMESIMLDYLEHGDFENKTNNASNQKINITTLGRGMSLGSRLSESDDETIRYALQSRKRAI